MFKDFINNLKEKCPTRIYSHDSDLDGFVSGNILYNISKILFGESPKILYKNYHNLDEIHTDKGEVIWVSDLNYNKSMDNRLNDLMFIVDHHRWEPDPIDCTPENPFCDKIYYIHDTTKSASLLCFELLETIVNNLNNNPNKEKYLKYIENIRDLVKWTNIGDIFKYNSTDELIEARSYARYFNDFIKPDLLNAHDILNCKEKDILPVFYNSYKKSNYYENYKNQLTQSLMYYEKELNKKRNEIYPGIFNLVYDKGDYSMIFNILLEKHQNIKAILTAIRNPNTGDWSLSVRSKDGKTAFYIAKKYFSGGGHPNASGAVLPNKFNRENISTEEVLEYITDKMNMYAEPNF